MQKMSVSLATSVCRMQNKGNVLFPWTMKPTKHFKTFLLFHIRQTDTAYENLHFFPYIISQRWRQKKTERCFINLHKPAGREQFDFG